MDQFEISASWVVEDSQEKTHNAFIRIGMHIPDKYWACFVTVADRDSPLLRSAIRKTGKLTDRAMQPGDICQMVKRRLKDAGLPTRLSPHSFRIATGGLFLG